MSFIIPTSLQKIVFFFSVSNLSHLFACMVSTLKITSKNTKYINILLRMKMKPLPLGLIWSRVSPNLNSPPLSLSFVCSVWLSVISLLCESESVPQWLSLSLTKDLALYLLQHRKYGMGKKRGVLYRNLSQGVTREEVTFLITPNYIALHTADRHYHSIATCLQQLWWVFVLRVFSTCWLFSANDSHAVNIHTYSGPIAQKST